MTKQTIFTSHEDVSNFFKYEEVKLGNLATKAAEWLAMYGPEAYIEIEAETCYDAGYLVAKINERRSETDEEYSLRLEREAQEKLDREAFKQANELREFKRLQAKFGANK